MNTADKGCCFYGLCTGGISAENPSDPRDNRDHILMRFFRDKLGRALSYTSFKLLILFGFLVYLLIGTNASQQHHMLFLFSNHLFDLLKLSGIYGCTQVREGLDRRKLSRDDSYSVEFYNVDDRNFRDYPHRIQLVLNETIDYSDPFVQQQVESVLQSFEQSEYIGPSSLTESWLRAYLRFLQRDESAYFLSGFNVSRSEDFYTALRDVFLQFPLAAHFRSDIDWDSTGRRIVASRHVLQSIFISDANAEKNMLIELRKIADSAPIKVTIFNQLFVFFDQFILVREVSLQTIT